MKMIRHRISLLFSMVTMLLIAALPALGAGSASGDIKGTAPAALLAPSQLKDWEAAHRFVGTWRMTEFKAVTGTGQTVYPMGQDAGGLIIWTDEGYMNGTIWRAGRQNFASPDQQLGTPEEFSAAGKSWVNYLGTYTVDAEAGTITHHVEQSFFPNWSGGHQVRFYRFTDKYDRLTLSTPPIPFGGTTIVASVSFERAD